MRLSQPVWPRFLPAGLVVNCATLGPVGHIRRGPGTWGSVAGLLYFTLFYYQLGVIGTLICSLPLLYLAVAFCGEAEFRMGKRDPGSVVLDEFVAIPLCFLGWPALLAVAPPWAIFLAGLLLFRIYDIAKPLGIHALQRLPGGWGVVADDVAAALATCVTLHALGWVLA